MQKYNQSNLCITGLGVTSAIGQGKTAFTTALMQGQHAFSVMQRPGRQKGTAFLGAEIASLSLPERFPRRLLRTLSLSGQVALATLQEAWDEAKLDMVASDRIGLIIGGDGVQFTAVGARIYKLCKERGLGVDLPRELFLQDEKYIP